MEGFEGSPVSDTSGVVPRAVILENNPSICVALEYLMLREGYVVELLREGSLTAPGPALLLAGAADRSGLDVFKVRDVAPVLEKLLENGPLEVLPVQAEGIRAFVPIPFGSKDVLRVVRAVDGFGIRESPGKV